MGFANPISLFMSLDLGGIKKNISKFVPYSQVNQSKKRIDKGYQKIDRSVRIKD